MRIAFVGKGGSGKTTLSALFSLFVDSIIREKVLLIDGDINMHLPDLLLEESFRKEEYLSNKKSIDRIKTFLKGDNKLITSLDSFRKTTLPGKGSNLIKIEDNNPIIREYSKKISPRLSLMVVGTYEGEGIGASCYHNNLAIAENILSHLKDNYEVVVMDMVAGTDSFASTLHAQFDIVLLIIEPTKRGVDVFNQYFELSRLAKVENCVFAIGNKIKNKEDIIFLKSNISQERLVGYFHESPYLRENDKIGDILDLVKLESSNKEVLQSIYDKLRKLKMDPNVRLIKLRELHKNYVSQGFIRDRFGDLTSQIDDKFKL